MAWGLGSESKTNDKNKTNAEKAGAFVYSKGKVVFDFVADKGKEISVY